MVPLRFVAEKLGAEVGWFDKTKHIVVIYGHTKQPCSDWATQNTWQIQTC